MAITGKVACLTSREVHGCLGVCFILCLFYVSLFIFGGGRGACRDCVPLV